MTLKEYDDKLKESSTMKEKSDTIYCHQKCLKVLQPYSHSEPISMETETGNWEWIGTDPSGLLCVICGRGGVANSEIGRVWIRRAECPTSGMQDVNLPSSSPTKPEESAPTTAPERTMFLEGRAAEFEFENRRLKHKNKKLQAEILRYQSEIQRIRGCVDKDADRQESTITLAGGSVRDFIGLPVKMPKKQERTIYCQGDYID